jgi:tetratricopeptide (TPR) repeat protein
MKRLLIIAVAALAAAGCSNLQKLRTDDQPYDHPFYAKYLNTGSNLDAQINRTMESLRQSPDSAELHNTLGALLLDKKFPKDAEREFERAVDADRKYYQAWYNLGVVRAANGDELGASRAFRRTVDLKPGHSQALFQLGLVEEKNHHLDRAVHLYAKAFAINPSLLRVEVNPRILDSKLTDVALLAMYATEHSRRSMQLQGTAIAMPAPPPPPPPPAPAPKPVTRNIVVPPSAARASGGEPTPVHAPSAPARRSRGRQPRPPAVDQNTPPLDPNAVPIPVPSTEPPPQPAPPPSE